MTECERLVSEGIIPASFLKEEVRDEYLVSKEIKKVWAIELDLFQTLYGVCQRHGIKLFGGFGTLLGAIRHRGFIPWDDDLDVWMLREDYNKFLSIASYEFDDPYFLQTTENDKDYFNPFARLRNSRTTGILVSKNNKCNNGIYLDIIPLDNINSNYYIQKIKNLWIYSLNVIANAYVYNVNPSICTRLAHYILHLPFVPYNPLKVYRCINKLAERKNKEKSEIGVVVYWPYSFDRNHFFSKEFDETVMMPFENIQMPVPKGYANILTILYGDYMKFPPIENRGIWHHFVFEPDVPYKEYCSIKYNVTY